MKKVVYMLCCLERSKVMRRLRIALVTSGCNRRGGIERVVYELALRFARNHDVHIYAGACELETSGAFFHRLPIIRWPWVANHLGFFLIARAAVFRDHRQKPFDIIHVQGIPAAIKSNFVTAHSVHSIGLRQQRLRQPRHLRFWYGFRAMDPVMKWLTGYNFYPARCDRAIAISNRVRDDLITTFGMPPERIDVIYNGVDIEAFSPAHREQVRSQMREQLRLNAGDAAAIFVANEFQRKGLDVLLHALGRMKAGIRPRLIVVGDTQDPALTLDDCKSMARSLGIADRVRFVGASDRVQDYFAAADFMVLPTLYEPFGLVILEAFAGGIPAVFSRCAGASEIVREGREAFLIDDPADVEEVASRMLPLACNPELRRAMGRAARETAVNYSWDAIAQSTIDCYYRQLSLA
jgi:glycosyltransferase involved in cell wall biosynthesis